MMPTMAGAPKMAQSDSTQDKRTLRLEMNKIDELFSAPDVNPSSTHALEILGESGIEYLRKRMMARWRRQKEIDRLIIQLPPVQSPNVAQTPDILTQQVGSAIRRYCAAHIASDRQALRLSRQLARRQGLIALVVTLFAIGSLMLLLAGNLGILADDTRGILIVLSLFAASLAIWDALESMLFDWVPFVIDSRIYHMISSLEVVVEFPVSSVAL
jgi:hypothetical protein